MRAVLEREISDGTRTYRLWRSAGKPDLDYPSAENDKYILHVEINGYLLPLRMTDWNLINHCGFTPAAEKLYGGKENRAGIGYDYDQAVERCRKKREKQRRDDDVGGEAMAMAYFKAQRTAQAKERKKEIAESNPAGSLETGAEAHSPWVEDL